MLSRSTLAHIYDKVKAKTTSSSIGSAKRGPLVLHRARNARIRFKQHIDFPFPAAAARSAADETIPKRQRSLIHAFNDADAPVSGATAAVPAIAVSPPPGQDDSDSRFASLLGD